jgi:hypothetical protein
MKSLTKLGIVVGVVIGCCITGTLLAQPPDDTDTNDTSAKVSGSITSNLSLLDMLGRSHDLETQVQGDLRHVRHLQEIARKNKDVIKLTCVNDKFLAIKAQANIFDDTHRELEGANAQSTERFNIFALVTQAAENVRKLRIEADACVGEREIGTETFNGVTHPPFPDDPTVGHPFDEGIEPPGYASPFN